MYGLLIVQNNDIKETGFCSIITKAIFISLHALNLSDYGYLMSTYAFRDKNNFNNQSLTAL
jgi:hypothetical protein